jgi:predicted DNA-binding transcriptional regulator YafY
VSAVKEKLTTYERRENIKLFLIKEKATTALRLSFMFDVSRQTIMNDIVFLSSRLPIITTKGTGGGIFLNSDFDGPKEYLNSEEEQLLLKLCEKVTSKDKMILSNIINKFSVPKDK